MQPRTPGTDGAPWTTTDWTTPEWRQVADRVYVGSVEPETVNLGLVVGAEGALVVDVGSSPAHGAAIRASVTAVTDRPLVAVVLTHGHYDHAYGLAAFGDLDTIGHESLTETLAGRDAPRRQIVVAAAVDLGGRRVEVVHLGRGHTAGDLVIVVPDADLVFVGDLVESAGPPAYGADSFPEDWPVTLDGVIGLMTGSTQAVPGHGDPVNREFVFGQRGRISAVASEIRRLATAGVPHADALAQGSWPYPAESLTDALAVGYAQLGGLRRRPNLPLAPPG